jgi:hypothetical protein
MCWDADQSDSLCHGRNLIADLYYGFYRGPRFAQLEPCGPVDGRDLAPVTYCQPAEPEIGSDGNHTKVVSGAR